MNKNRRLTRALSLLLLLTLLTLAVTACNLTDLFGATVTEAPTTTATTTTAPTTTATTTAPTPSETPALPEIWNSATYRADCTLGTGSRTVTLKVTAADHTVSITLLTDAETLADALLAENLCQGETSQYGLYISHVNGIRADYTLDNGYWWNLIVNGESSMVGASGVTVTAGDVYEFVRTK